MYSPLNGIKDWDKRDWRTVIIVVIIIAIIVGYRVYLKYSSDFIFIKAERNTQLNTAGEEIKKMIKRQAQGLSDHWEELKHHPQMEPISDINRDDVKELLKESAAQDDTKY